MTGSATLSNRSQLCQLRGLSRCPVITQPNSGAVLSSICVSDETSRSPRSAEELRADATDEDPKFSRLWWYIDSRENVAIEYPWFALPHHENAADI
jgi:hypothetical protein